MRMTFLKITLSPIIARWYSWKRAEETGRRINSVSETKAFGGGFVTNTLREIVDILDPEWLIGVGAFAEKRATIALSGMELR